MILKFFKTHPDAQIPTRANPTDSGMDLTSVDDDFLLKPGERKLVSTGLKMSMENQSFEHVGNDAHYSYGDKKNFLEYNWELQIRPRSGLALKHGITVLNSPGTIDFSYRGNIGVLLINHGQEPFEVKKGSKIAQMIVAKFYIPEIEVVLNESDLGTTSRGEGGFGSTDKKS